MEQMLVQLMPLFLIFAIFYFLLIRPQQRRAKEHKEMVAGVQRGDKIVSSGGIRGKVVKVVGDFDVEVEISQGVNVTLVKSTIAEVVKESAPKWRKSKSRHICQREPACL